MRLGERLVTFTLTHVKKTCRKEMAHFKRDLKIPKAPFAKITYTEAYKKFGPEFEIVLSERHEDPFWIVDIPLEQREFYDREDPKRHGILLDYDLIYPEGFGEALSGGEREYEYERIKKRILQFGMKVDELKWFLEFAKLGIPKSAGFGIGVERLTRFCCGVKRIDEVSLFPKIPGSWGP
jgi:asparaginyl-tRNA synthetase